VATFLIPGVGYVEEPTSSGTYLIPGVGYVEFEVAGVTAALTGTITDDDESDIVSGGSTIILTLTNDTWVATVGGDNAITEALIAGIDSAQSEAGGWDAKVKAVMDFNEVVRTSDTVVTITLDAYADYDITAQETITVTIPATALTTSGDAVVASPTFTVDFVVSGLAIPIAMYHYQHSLR